MREYQLATFIGRMQPPHNGHIQVIKQGLELADTVLIMLGSYRATQTIKNPFTYEQRRTMLWSCFTEEEQLRIHIRPLRDFYNQDSHWVSQVQNTVAEFEVADEAICKLGSKKDASSFYLDLFPDWEWEPPMRVPLLDATNIRTHIFETPDNPAMWMNQVPPSVLDYIHTNFKGPEFTALKEEYDKIKKYKALWKESPFAPTFQTADSVVICSGHVLVVKRKYAPGKGLFALPGGYIKQGETIQQCAIRELKEETKINILKKELDSCIVARETFDHPGRSLIGRVITTAFVISLPSGRLPAVHGSDDAEKAIWMSFNDVNLNEHSFFDDHVHIIRWAQTRIK